MTSPRLKVALLSGGKSKEREVSLNSGRQVFQALDPAKYEVTRYDPAEDLPRLINDAPGLDAALIIMHGRFGEDGTIQGLLELLGLPYVGSGVLGSALCMDKCASKQLYRFHDFLTARDLVLDRNDPLPSDRIVEILGLPLVIKPASEGSSVGMSIPKTKTEIEAGLALGFEHDRRLIVEEFIEGREITASVLGDDNLEALPLIEIIPGDQYDFFNYEAKYKPGASLEICPAEISPDLTQKVQDLALRAHRVLMCRGFSRSDFILKDDSFYILETNTIPGLTETSLFPQAARAAGYSFGEVLDKLIGFALAG